MKDIRKKNRWLREIVLLFFILESMCIGCVDKQKDECRSLENVSLDEQAEFAIRVSGKNVTKKIQFFSCIAHKHHHNIETDELAANIAFHGKTVLSDIEKKISFEIVNNNFRVVLRYLRIVYFQLERPSAKYSRSIDLILRNIDRKLVTVKPSRFDVELRNRCRNQISKLSARNAKLPAPPTTRPQAPRTRPHARGPG